MTNEDLEGLNRFRELLELVSARLNGLSWSLRVGTEKTNLYVADFLEQTVRAEVARFEPMLEVCIEELRQGGS